MKKQSSEEVRYLMASRFRISRWPDFIRLDPWMVLFLMLVVTFTIYSNTFDATFHFDDTPNITENPRIKDLSNFRDLSDARYVGDLSFAINYYFGGLDVFGYHLINTIIHSLNGFLVYVLLIKLYGITALTTNAVMTEIIPETNSKRRSPGATIALIASVLFVVHPIQTQSVTYIVQRYTSLATLFYLLALVAYLHWRTRALTDRAGLGCYLGALCFTVLGMKTKEITFTLPFMIFLLEWLFFGPANKIRGRWLVPFFLTLPIIPISRMEILGEADDAFLPRGDLEMPRIEYFATQLRVTITYLRLLFLPIHQNLDYDYPRYGTLLDITVLLSLATLLGLFSLAFYLIFRIKPWLISMPMIAYGILWFFLTLTVESLIVLLPDVIFEHRMYLPSIGFFIAVTAAGHWGIHKIGIGLPQSKSKKGQWIVNAIPIALVALVASLSIGTYHRNRIWKDEVSLWSDVVRKSPDKSRPHVNLGVAFQDQGLFEEALEQYQIALSLKPNDPKPHTNMGNIYKDQGRVDEAKERYETALRIKPDYSNAHTNLGLLLKEAGDIDLAVEKYKIALQHDPNDSVAHNNLANALSAKGHLEEAKNHYRKALTLKPEYTTARFNLAVFYEDQALWEEAISEYQSVLTHDPLHTKALNNLGGLYKQTGRLEEAIQVLQRAVTLEPDQALSHFNLGHAFLLSRQFERAVRSFREGLSQRPDAMAEFSLGLAFEQLHKPIEAMDSYRRALELLPSHEGAQQGIDRLAK